MFRLILPLNEVIKESLTSFANSIKPTYVATSADMEYSYWILQIFLALGTHGLFLSVSSSLSSFLCFGRGQPLWRCPSAVAAYLLALCRSAKETDKLIGNDFAVLFLLFDRCHNETPFVGISKRFKPLCGFCVRFLCAVWHFMIQKLAPKTRKNRQKLSFLTVFWWRQQDSNLCLTRWRRCSAEKEKPTVFRRWVWWRQQNSNL